MTEKCSSIACRQKPIIEIVAWNGITLDTHLFLCRKHWEDRITEDAIIKAVPPLKTKVIGFYKDLRHYL